MASNPPPTDLKQTLREKAKRRLSITSLTRQGRSTKQKANVSDLIDNDIEEITQNVNVQVRQREPSSPEKGRSKLDMLKEQTTGALDNLKRPLTGLLKRPGSRSVSRERNTAAGVPATPATPSSLLRQVSTDHELLDQVELPSVKKVNKMEDGQIKNQGVVKKKMDSWLDNAAKLVRPGSSAGNRRSSTSGSKTNLDQSQTTVPVDGNVLNTDLNAHEQQQQQQNSTPVEMSHFSAKGMSEEQSTFDDNTELPNIEEIRSIEYGAAVAQAPNVAVNTVSSYQDLDGELSRHAAFQSLDGIDLSLLTKCLCSESEVRDEPVSWSWDYLYTTVCSELRRDWGEHGEIDDNRTDLL